MSIIPYETKNKRLMILPSGKLKDVSIGSRTYLIPLSTKKVSNVSDALEECQKEKRELQEIIDMGSDKVLTERVKHQDVIMKAHSLFCSLINTEVMFSRCVLKRKSGECPRLCSIANKFIGK